MLEAYLQSLLAIVAASPIVRASDVTLDQRVPRAGLIRGDLYFADGSRLHFRELVEAQAQVMRRMYSYHYQAADTTGWFGLRFKCPVCGRERRFTKHPDRQHS